MHAVGQVALPQHQMKDAESFSKFVTGLGDTQWNTICFLIDKSGGKVATTLVLKQANGAGIMTVRDIKIADASLQLVNSEIGHPVSFKFEGSNLSIRIGREEHVVATADQIKDSARTLFGKDIAFVPATPVTKLRIPAPGQ